MPRFKGITKNHKCKIAHSGATQPIQYPKQYYNERRYRFKRGIKNE